MPPEDIIPPASSDSPETPNSSSETAGPASSSQIVDIPLSHEPVSSSVQEALSSLVESSSSEAAPASSEVAPTSSDAAPESSAVAPASSETAPESSSNIAPSSSSLHGWGDTDPSSSSNRYSEECPDNDPWCIQVRMCEDQPGGCMVASMVTTFERDDVTG